MWHGMLSLPTLSGKYIFFVTAERIIRSQTTFSFCLDFQYRGWYQASGFVFNFSWKANSDVKNTCKQFVQRKICLSLIGFVYFDLEKQNVKIISRLAVVWNICIRFHFLFWLPQKLTYSAVHLVYLKLHILLWFGVNWPTIEN